MSEIYDEPTSRQRVDDIVNYEPELTSWEEEFIQSAWEQDYPYTLPQHRKIAEIWEKI